MVCNFAGDVPGWDRGDPGRDRARSVRQDSGGALQADRQVRLQPALSGSVDYNIKARFTKWDENLDFTK